MIQQPATLAASAIFDLVDLLLKCLASIWVVSIVGTMHCQAHSAEIQLQHQKTEAVLGEAVKKAQKLLADSSRQHAMEQQTFESSQKTVILCQPQEKQKSPGGDAALQYQPTPDTGAGSLPHLIMMDLTNAQFGSDDVRTALQQAGESGCVLTISSSTNCYGASSPLAMTAKLDSGFGAAMLHLEWEQQQAESQEFPQIGMAVLFFNHPTAEEPGPCF